MSHEQFTTLAARARGGDENAMEQLLRLSYTPVYHQCRVILQNQQAARELTREILNHIYREPYSLENPRHFENWLNRVTARRCIQTLAQLPKSFPSPRQAPPPTGQLLSDEETIKIVQRIVDELPDDPRTALVLYCCGGLSIRNIARQMDLNEETVSNLLNQGQEIIRNRLEALDSLGVNFPVIPPLPVLMRASMEASQDPKAAAQLVDDVLGKTAAKAARRPLPVVPILASIAAVLILVLALMLFMIVRAPAPEPDLITGSATEQSETTVVTTQVTETTAGTTAETTEETTSATTGETTEPSETTIETTVAATEAPVAAAGGGGGQAVTGGAPKYGSDGHAHKYRIIDNNNFSCETGGSTTMQCVFCGYKYDTVLPALGDHTLELMPNGAYTKSPTCEKASINTYMCIKCFKLLWKEDPSRPALGHDMAERIHAPEVGREGYTEHYCTRCNHHYNDSYVPALPEPSPEPAPEPEPEPAPEPEPIPDPVPNPEPEPEPEE